MLRGFFNRIVIPVFLIGSLSLPASLRASPCDERDVAMPDVVASTLKVTVPEIEASLSIGRDAQEFSLRLIIAVHVENSSDAAQTIAREQFQLLINGEPAEIGSVDAHPNFPRSTVTPGESAEGWVGFGSIVYDGKEPSIILRWQPPAVAATDQKPIDINLNEEFRRQSGFQQTRLGPEGCLLQITTNRNLDVLAIWPVASALKSAATAKIERILISSTREQPPVIQEEFNLWLTAMLDNSASANDPNMRFIPRVAPPFPRQQIQFQQILIGGLTEAVNRQYGLYRRPILVLPTAEAAIANALTPVYRHIPMPLVVADLRHADPGVRRAAMAGAADRLTPEQAAVIIDEALQGSPELQIELAGYLNLIPGSKSVKALRVLSESSHPQVSRTALRSLIGSLDPAAETAMTELWQASRSKPENQNQILSAIIQLNGERWTSLVAGYVAEKLQDAATGAGTSVDVDDNPASLLAPDIDEPSDAFGPPIRSAPNQRSLLSAALAFLRQQRHAGTLDALRNHLLQLSDPALQDIALAALVEARDSADDAVIRQCLDQRIRSEQISDSVRSAVVQLPSPKWTKMLLKDLKSNIDASHQPLSAQAVLRCASAGQLDLIIDDFDSLPPAARQQTLRHLVMLDHPRWKPLAQTLIETPFLDTAEKNTAERSIARSIASETIQLLAIDASEESIAMLTARLAKAVEEIGTTEDIPIENRMYVHRLIETIAMFAHPECRRSLNRVARCENKGLREKAALQIQDAERRSPAIQLLAQRLMMLGKNEERFEDNEETLAMYTECIEQDPYLPRMYVQRASVLMHLNRFDETMRDLKIGDRLSPENMDIESMIALCQIRQGDSEAGLKYAEKLVVTAPRDLSSLYNGACSYSRALENSNVSEEQKKRYGDRAIELLRLTIATEFGDFEHLQKDEDLVAIHTHPEWPAVVEETKKMYEEKKKKAPE
ncbi:MAG: hypothetical protein WKF77_27830 [Planctomycetaceae bacterium]